MFKSSAAVRVALAIMLCVAMTGVVSAEVEKGRIYVGPEAGVALPFGDLGDFAGVGFTIGGTGDYMVTNNLGIGGDILINFFGGEDYSGPDYDASYSFRIIEVSGHAHYFFNPSSNTCPFVTGGLGIYNGDSGVEIEGDGFQFEGDGSSSDLGLKAGGGVIMNAGEKMKLIVQGAINIVSGDNYLNATVGLLFPFGGN